MKWIKHYLKKKLSEILLKRSLIFFLRNIQIELKSFKVANEVEKTSSSPTLTNKALDHLDEKKIPLQKDQNCVKLIINNNNNNNNTITKMPPASSPPALSTWAPILFPPWNPTGLLPAAFYPAALRSLPK